MSRELRQIIEKRVDDATPTESKFNNWPTYLGVIKTIEYDLSNAKEAYEAGLLMGKETYAYRQIFPDRIPYGLDKNHWMVSVKFFPDHAKGQMDDWHTRNLLAVFEACLNPSAYFHEKKMVVVAIELGCNHEYEVRTPYSCYREGKCKKCGHQYAVDSSG